MDRASLPIADLDRHAIESNWQLAIGNWQSAIGNYMSEHIVSVRIYLTIFLVLLAGTALTVIAAFHDFPWKLNAIVALTIATIKGTFVVLYFMHVRYSSR